MDLTIELLMRIFQVEIEHCLHLCDFKGEAQVLEFIWSNLEAKLIEEGLIPDLVCGD